MTNKQWKAICADIEDRRGIKWEWAKIDADVKKDIRKAWEAILSETTSATSTHAPIPR